MSPSRWLAIFAAFALLAVGAAACGSSDDSSTGGGSGSASGEIAGAGSSAQEAAQEAWIAEFENANSAATISYDPVGSGGGREQFIAGGTAYAGSDAALEEEEGELKKALERCKPGQLIEIPAYVSPIAVVYNLEGVEGLQLSAGNAWRRSSARKSPPGTTGDRRGKSRSRTAGHPDNTGQPLRRVGNDGELRRLPLEGRRRRSGHMKSAATGRSRAARPRTAPPVSSKRSVPATARSATPTPARPGNSGSPRSRSVPNTSNRRQKRRRKSSRSRRKRRTSRRRPTCSRSNWTGRPTRRAPTRSS